MNKTQLKLKTTSVIKPKTNKARNHKVAKKTISDGFIHTMVSRRIDELSLPPMRTLIENKDKFKRILTDRQTQSIEEKLKHSVHSRCGEDEDRKSPSMSCFSEPKYKRKKSIDKVARAKYLADNRQRAIRPVVLKPSNLRKKDSSGPSRIDELAKPLQRRLPEPVSDNPIICNVKPSSLHYIANERILQLAKPKNSIPKVTNKRRKKKSIQRYTSRKWS